MADLVRNSPVQTALDAWAEAKDVQRFGRVLGRAMVGELLLDAGGSTFADAEKGFQRGDTLAIASQVDNAGKRLLLAYTDNERLAAATGATPPRSLVQPAVAVLEQAAAEFEGIVIDARHPGMFIAYADELRRGLGAEPARAARLATDLAERTRPFDAFLDDLAAAPVYIAVAVERSAEGEVRSVSVQLATGADGAALSPLFTSPSEVWAWTPQLEARETRLANVARVALDDGHAGIIVNPTGPSATLPRELLEGLAAGSTS